MEPIAGIGKKTARDKKLLSPSYAVTRARICADAQADPPGRHQAQPDRRGGASAAPPAVQPKMLVLPLTALRSPYPRTRPCMFFSGQREQNMECGRSALLFFFAQVRVLEAAGQPLAALVNNAGIGGSLPIELQERHRPL